MGDALANEQRSEETWTPVNESRVDRRTFFYNDGKAHHLAEKRPKGGEGDRFEAGELTTVPVADIHFGNPRVKVMDKEPAPMPTMLKWPPEKFKEQVMQCAQISFGDYWVWCAIGVSSNRLLYAAKRASVPELQVVVVEQPPPANPDEDFDLTYGANLQGIQLVP